MAVQLHFIGFTEQGSKVRSFFFFQLTLVTFSQNSQNSVSLLHEDSVHVSSHIGGFMFKLPSRIVQGKNLVTCKTVRKLEKAWKKKDVMFVFINWEILWCHILGNKFDFL